MNEIVKEELDEEAHTLSEKEEVVVLLEKQNSLLNMIVDELEKIHKELMWIRREL
jgi:hypothetical protein